MTETNRHKVAVFADRLQRVIDNSKADVEAVLEDAKKADIDTSALRRLVSWKRKDRTKREDQEAIDEQYRFLAGERPTPAQPPTDGELSVAIRLYGEKKTVREVADELKISVGKAHKLKSMAALFTVHAEMNTVNKATTEAQDFDLTVPPHLRRTAAEAAR
jgi:uncharacterized protein (UPF0335 family)